VCVYACVCVCVNYRASVLTSISKLSEGMLRGMEKNRFSNGLKSLFKRVAY